MLEGVVEDLEMIEVVEGDLEMIEGVEVDLELIEWEEEEGLAMMEEVGEEGLAIIEEVGEDTLEKTGKEDLMMTAGEEETTAENQELLTEMKKTITPEIIFLIEVIGMVAEEALEGEGEALMTGLIKYQI
jgi:hypothetical protein